ncbi:MAG: glutamate--tRNA ligase, partial [Chitinophagaceae bacterium]
DDHLMEITHAFRGEEWLPSAPVHILLWRWLFGEAAMPQWAHLPLILGPSGKLSKRDGAKYGFPVFAASWNDPIKNELTEGFRERGFLPEAFVNLLALLGWNDGTEQELFSLDELTQRFQMEKVHKGGAKFDFEKAQWFNHEWIKRSSADRLLPDVKTLLTSQGMNIPDDTKLARVIDLVKERCTLVPDFAQQAGFFFTAPSEWDTAAFAAKWTQEKQAFFDQYADRISTATDAASYETIFKQGAEESGIKPGELQLPLRIMLVGGKFGPPVFAIAEVLGPEETARRIRAVLPSLKQ